MDLNYWMMVERYPNLKEEVGGSFPGYEISSLLDRQLATWSIASCALVLACRPSIYIYNITLLTMSAPFLKVFANLLYKSVRSPMD